MLLILSNTALKTYLDFFSLSKVEMGDKETLGAGVTKEETLGAGATKKFAIYYLQRRRVVAEATRRLKMQLGLCGKFKK